MACQSVALKKELWQKEACLETNAFDDVQDLLLFVRRIFALVQKVLHVPWLYVSSLDTKTVGGDETSLPGESEPRPVSWLALLFHYRCISNLEYRVTSWPTPQFPDPVAAVGLLLMCCTCHILLALSQLTAFPSSCARTTAIFLTRSI